MEIKSTNENILKDAEITSQPGQTLMKVYALNLVGKFKS
jgi:hypothetical protein